MKINPKEKCAVCEQCNRPGPVADNLQDIMRLAVEAGWDYHDPGPHEFTGVFPFFCPTCKLDWDCGPRNNEVPGHL